VSSVHLRWGLVSLALLSCTFPFQAQTVSSEGQAPTPTFKAETRAVDVDVVVLDSHGQPVKGLRREDFVIAEDGTSQTATFFEEHPSETGPSDATASFFEKHASGPAPSDAVATTAATNVLLIDTLNTPKDDSIYVRKRVGDFLKSMPAGTSLAVFSLGQTLRMVQGFTSDRAMLLAAVENNKTGAWSETSAASNMPLDDVDDRMRAQEMAIMNPIAGNTHMVENAQAMQKTYQNDQRIAMTVATLQRLARYLAKTPGRKNLIWFSSAFPAAVFPSPNPRAFLMPTMTTNHDQQIRETTNLLALARVAIYPVQGQGIAGQITGDANDHFGSQQRPLPGVPTGGAPPSDTYQQNSNGDNYSVTALSKGLKQEDSTRATNDAAMHALASETGGQVLPASNDLSAVLARAIRNGSQYYSLSYTPTNRKADGSFRRIEVKLRNGDDRLAYRRGYYATDAMLGTTPGAITDVAKPMAGDPLTPLMRRGMIAWTQVAYDVHAQVENPQPAEDAVRIGGNPKLTGPVTRYGVEFVIHRSGEPAAARQSANPDSTRADQMQLEVIAFDGNGNALNWQAGTMNVKASDDATVKERRIHTSMEIDVPKGVTSLTTGVYDWSTGQAGTQEITINSAGVPEEAHAPAGLPSLAGMPLTGTPSPGSSGLSKAAPAAPREPKLVQRTPEVVKRAVKADRRIHLDVVVSDTSGQVISGLEQSNFTILDNNTSQPIQSFRAVDGLTTEPPMEIVLVLDTMNTSFQQMAVVRQGVEKFLRQNGGHLVLSVSAIFLTDTGVKANQATRDGNALAADIEKLPTPVHAINSAQGLDGLMLRFGRSVDALSQMTRYEATKPGRKLMIWVGSGWPMLSNARYHMDPKNQASFFHSIVDLSTNLREARVTLYGILPLDLNRGTEAYAFLYQNFMKGVESAKQADAGNLSLQVLAEQSGGRAIGPTGDIYGSLVGCVADANAYYELSFDAAPTSTVDAYHALQVMLDKPGLVARSNTGYYSEP
jgi:VWFA-related protein